MTLADTLDLLAQALDSAFDSDILDADQYDAVGALVWGVLAAHAGQEPPAPLPAPAELAAALDDLSDAI